MLDDLLQSLGAAGSPAVRSAQVVEKREHAQPGDGTQEVVVAEVGGPQPGRNSKTTNGRLIA